jgi:hypothetical protein
MHIYLFALFLFLSFSATAQTPIPRVGNSCPAGSYTSGDFCKPMEHAPEHQAIVKHGSDCPTGYRSSGSSYCKRLSNSDSDVVHRPPKTPCPRGTYRSGEYCSAFESTKQNGEIIILKSGKKCPAGYISSGSGHCKRFSSSDRVAIPRDSGTKCPYGWRTSGSYCIEQ